MSSNAPILAEEKQKYVSAVGLSFSLTFNVSSFGAGTSVRYSAADGLVGVNVVKSVRMKCNQQARDRGCFSFIF